MENGKSKLKPIDFWKLSTSAWLVVLMALILPYQSTDGFKAIYGYPLAFLSTYNTPPRIVLLSSITVNGIALTIDIAVVYYIKLGISKIMHKIRVKRNMG